MGRGGGGPGLVQNGANGVFFCEKNGAGVFLEINGTNWGVFWDRNGGFFGTHQQSWG